MTWNYRMTVQRFPAADDLYEIREIHYGEDGGLSWTREPIAPGGSSRWELLTSLNQIVRDATSNPILDITDEKHPIWV